NIEDELIDICKEYIKSSRHNNIVLQKRYIKGSSPKVILGELKDEIYAVENGLKIKLNLLSNQNSGYFPDMKNGREYIRTIANNKRILNLFSYTCGFSLSAISGGASSVVNIDMAKSALTTGRVNHHLNNFSTSTVSFFPYNILKSFSRIKKKAQYDIIIIDPPTFQKGSFEATKDYNKIIKKLELIAAKNCIVLACLNSPDLDIDFIIDIFKTEAPSFKFEKRLKNVVEFESIDESRSLKNLVFKRDLI
ncbi:MAG: class I SAM-dependent methyltransferase, partial [Arcobacteraceae bacterium]|nr:class I SAM-dependent methyltransferase [Arcobacteraceae bacterium]